MRKATENQGDTRYEELLTLKRNVLVICTRVSQLAKHYFLKRLASIYYAFYYLLARYSKTFMLVLKYSVQSWFWFLLKASPTRREELTLMNNVLILSFLFSSS